MTSVSQPAPADRATRLAVDLGGTMRDAEWRPIEVEVANISATGFGMTTREALAIGDVVTVAIGGLGAREAVIVRAMDGGYGCRFREPLPEDAVLAAESNASGTVAMLPAARVAEPVMAAVPVGMPMLSRIAVMVGAAAGLWAAIWAVGRLLR